MNKINLFRSFYLLCVVCYVSGDHGEKVGRFIDTSTLTVGHPRDVIYHGTYIERFICFSKSHDKRAYRRFS